MMMWTEKYRPKKVEEVLGNPKTASELRNYRWDKPAILYGPTGVGKTSLVNALARELNLSIVEINDENISEGKTAAESRSLYGGGKLIVFDNVDQMENIKEVAEIIKTSKNPVILVTSDIESKKLANIKKMCEKFQMKKPAPVSVMKLLENICIKEGIEVDKEVLKKISENSQGDFRAAVNDLETACRNRKKVTLEDLNFISERDVSSDLYKFLSTVFFRKDVQEAVQMVYDLDEQPQNILLWIDENLPAVVRGSLELSRCYGYISKADVFIGRINSRQYWGFLRYANSLMSAGIIVSRGDKVNFARYQFPSYIIKMGQTRKERELKKRIGLKMSYLMHCTPKTAAKEYIPLYKTLIKAGRIDINKLSETFRLNEEEAEYMLSGSVNSS